MADKESYSLLRLCVNCCVCALALPFFVTNRPCSVALILGFTIPRVPGVAFNGDTPLVPASGAWNNSIPTQFSAAPANFSFPAFTSLQLDTGSTFVPITFRHLRAQILDSDTSALVATGDLGHTKVPAKTFTSILLPLNFTYSAVNSSDQTCK